MLLHWVEGKKNKKNTDGGQFWGCTAARARWSWVSPLSGAKSHPICAVECPGCPLAAWGRDCLTGAPLKAKTSYCVLTWWRQKTKSIRWGKDPKNTKIKKTHIHQNQTGRDYWNITKKQVKMLLLWMRAKHYLLSPLALSWDVSCGQALPSILFLASAYSASRWARDLTCGVGLFWLKGDPSEPLLAGRFRMRIWGGGAAGRESSCITMAVFSRVGEEFWRESLKTAHRKHR